MVDPRPCALARWSAFFLVFLLAYAVLGAFMSSTPPWSWDYGNRVLLVIVPVVLATVCTPQRWIVP